jgi:Rieske Fe-S protein
MDRKEFIVKGCALCGVTSALVFMDSCNKAVITPVNFTLDLTQAANAPLATVGGYVIQDNAIVIKTSSGYNAFSLVCSHEGCTVSYQGSSGFRCPCHGGTFDAAGNKAGGPPPTGLQKLTVTQNGNILTVKSS